MISNKGFLQYWMGVLLILVLSGGVFFYNLGKISLWDPDEPRGAVIAYEMLKNKDWIHLSYNGESVTKTPALVKPPLYYWSIASFSALRGRVDELSARLPSALAGIGTALLVFFLGRRIFGQAPALLGALIFISNHMIFEQARSAEIDMTLSLLITFTLFLFYSCYHGLLPENTILAAYAAMGLAVLAKGPVGVLVPAMVAFLYLLLRRDGKALFRLKPVTGLLVILIVASPWFLMEGKAFGTEFFFRQNFDRFFHAFDHQQPLYYYLVKLPLHFMPWTLLLPATVAYWFHGGKEKNTGRVFLLVWFLSTLIFFSLSQSKRSLYIVPLYPPLSLLAGEALYGILKEERFARLVPWVKGGSLVFALLLVVVGIVGLFVVLTHFPDLGSKAAAMTLCILAASGVLVGLARKPGMRDLLTLFFILAFGLELFAAGMVYPELDVRSRSSKKLCHMVAQLIGESDLGAVGFHPPSAVFYINRETNRTFHDFGYRLEEGIAFLNQNRTVYCLMSRPIYEQARKQMEEIAMPVSVPGLPLKGWKWDVVLLTNRPHNDEADKIYL